MPDWDAIQKEYEAGGISLRTLATKYGIPPSTLHLRSKSWTLDTGQQKKLDTGHFQLQLVKKVESPSPVKAVEGANLGIEGLVEHLRNYHKEMDLSDHAKAAHALWEYNRIVVNAPPMEDEEEEEEDFSVLSDDELQQFTELKARVKKRHA